MYCIIGVLFIVKMLGVVLMDRRGYKLFRDFKNMIYLSVFFVKIVDFKFKIIWGLKKIKC